MWNAVFFRMLLSSHRLMQDSATSQKIVPFDWTPRSHFFMEFMNAPMSKVHARVNVGND